MASGSIKTINEDRGFGFISADDAADDADLFFHHTAVRDGEFANLRVGQRVEFEEGADPRDPRRRRANDVTSIED